MYQDKTIPVGKKGGLLDQAKDSIRPYTPIVETGPAMLQKNAACIQTLEGTQAALLQVPSETILHAQARYNNDIQQVE